MVLLFLPFFCMSAAVTCTAVAATTVAFAVTGTAAAAVASTGTGTIAAAARAAFLFLLLFFAVLLEFLLLLFVFLGLLLVFPLLASHAKLAAVCNHDAVQVGWAVIRPSLDALHTHQNIHALHDLTENNVLAVKVRGVLQGDEKLRPVRPGSSIGHGQQSRSGVADLKVLVREPASIDRLTAGPVATFKVPALTHEVRDDPMEDRAFVVQRLASGASNALLAGTEAAEVLRCARNNAFEELEHQPTDRLAPNGDVEEGVRLGVGHRGACRGRIAGNQSSEGKNAVGARLTLPTHSKVRKSQTPKDKINKKRTQNRTRTQLAHKYTEQQPVERKAKF